MSKNYIITRYVRAEQDLATLALVVNLLRYFGTSTAAYREAVHLYEIQLMDRDDLMHELANTFGEKAE